MCELKICRAFDLEKVRRVHAVFDGINLWFTDSALFRVQVFEACILDHKVCDEAYGLKSLFCMCLDHFLTSPVVS